MKNRVAIVGGGVAGMQTALALKGEGFEPVIIERSDRLGGHVADWHRLFPSFTPAGEVLEPLRRRVADAGIETLTGAEACGVSREGVTLRDGRKINAAATVLCSGFELFDPRIKEEYGYKIYRNVFTTADVERMFNEGRIVTEQGEAPRRIAFLHCVGSRDEKVGAHHCSKVCCITAIKQAMEMKEMLPGSEIFSFYMDIRMFGPGYEELYREAQLRHNIQFIRGRISEASQTIDDRIQIKAEDTLVGRPLKMTVDMLVLVVGMKGGAGNRILAESGGLGVAENGFLSPRDHFFGNTMSEADNIFYAGAVTAPKNIGESINEGVAAARKVADYLNGAQVK